ncbi:MAG: response regulator transcription factor [Bacteroidota bacterium]
MSNAGPFQLALIEDDPEVRSLMKLLLNSGTDYYCRAYENAEAFLKELPLIDPDLILMDIDLGPGLSGIEALKKIHQTGRKLNTVMLTIHEDDDSVFGALCAGATGYLIKGASPVQLLEDVRQACLGGAPMSPRIARRVVSTFHIGQSNPLSKREKEVLAMLCEGDSYKGISEKLFISGSTVRTHIKHIYEKLEVHSRAEVVSKAIREKLI